MRNAALLLVVPLLSACYGMKGPLNQSELRTASNIGVVSLLGESFHGVRVGTTAFGNITYDAPVGDWKVDEITERLIVERLTHANSVRAAPLTNDGGLQKRFAESWSFMNNGFDYKEVLSLARQQGFDTLLIVQPTGYSNAKFHKPGYGFFERTFLGSSDRCVYSLFTIDVFSVASGRRMGWEWGFPCASGETEIEWKEKFDDYSASERELLRKRTEMAVTSNVMKALSELGYQ